jgi:RNA polymerase sigma factor (sigma-70 family)
MPEMPPESTAELLRKFTRNGSEEAFAELTARFAGMVYAAADRRLGKVRHQAADVTQAVFILLARRARALPEDIVLSAWLLRQTMRQALNTLRAERRRMAREQIAAVDMKQSDNPFRQENSVQETVPDLDQHLLRLPARERDALMLRFFEEQSLAGVAKALGISENAAQKRVARGLDRLRRRVAGPAAATATAVLATSLSAHASTKLPHGLLRSLASHALVVGKTAPAGGLVAISEAWRRHPVPALMGAGMAMVAGGGLVDENYE